MGPDIDMEALERIFVLGEASVSLATVLEKHKLEVDLQLKLLLSYLIAKATWQFYGSKSMDAHWTKEAIHFMRERRSEFSGQGEVLTLIHKPFLAIDLTLAPTPGDPTVDGDTHTQDFAHRFPRAAHWYPSIPALGIMFLEIDLGEGIEGHRSSESLGQNGGSMGNADHFTAGMVIWSPSWKNCRTFQAVKEIIDMCLKGHK